MHIKSGNLTISIILKSGLFITHSHGLLLTAIFSPFISETEHKDDLLSPSSRYVIAFVKICNVHITPHLKWKKLSNNSSWDFEHVLDTMDDYWVGQDENFCPESTPTRWRCYHFPKKWSKSKFDPTLSMKKPFVTPKFCGRNFSWMHHFEDMNFLSPVDCSYSFTSL